MQYSIKDKNLETLLIFYSQEIDLLKEKLLNGESWESLFHLRRNITELAIALQKQHNYIVSQQISRGNPAEYPQPGAQSAQPAE